MRVDCKLLYRPFKSSSSLSYNHLTGVFFIFFRGFLHCAKESLRTRWLIQTRTVLCFCFLRFIATLQRYTYQSLKYNLTIQSPIQSPLNDTMFSLLIHVTWIYALTTPQYVNPANATTGIPHLRFEKSMYTFHVSTFLISISYKITAKSVILFPKSKFLSKKKKTSIQTLHTVHFFLATCNVCPWPSQSPLHITQYPINGNSFIQYYDVISKKIRILLCIAYDVTCYYVTLRYDLKL